jgi:serine/threonine protein kinase
VRNTHILRYVEVFEDSWQLYLIYESLGTKAVSLLEKIYEDTHNESEVAGGERMIAHTLRALLHALKFAHTQGKLHGAIGINSVFLEKREASDSVRLVDFGLYRLFEPRTPWVYSGIAYPRDVRDDDPTPPFHIDFWGVGDILHLCIAGIPACADAVFRPNAALRVFRMGRCSFSEQMWAKATEPIKLLLGELMLAHETKRTAAQILDHVFFQDFSEDRLPDQPTDSSMIRSFTKWRGQHGRETDGFQALANYRSTSLRLIQKQTLDQRTEMAADAHCSWPEMISALQQHLVISSDNYKVLVKAFEPMPEIDIKVFFDVCIALRYDNCQRVLWDNFAGVTEGNEDEAPTDEVKEILLEQVGFLLPPDKSDGEVESLEKRVEHFVASRFPGQDRIKMTALLNAIIEY